jgi:hypothetical protein
MGGELHPLHYGSYFDKRDELLSIMKAEEDFILKSPGRNNRRIWIDLYETVLSDDIIEALLLHLNIIRHKIYNLCLVGCSSADKRKIKNKMKVYKMDLFDITQYFSDPEIAKKWLLGKKY